MSDEIHVLLWKLKVIYRDRTKSLAWQELRRYYIQRYLNIRRARAAKEDNKC